jgi:hypothetical protein
MGLTQSDIERKEWLRPVLRMKARSLLGEFVVVEHRELIFVACSSGFANDF